MTQRPINLGQPINRACPWNRGLYAWFLRLPQVAPSTTLVDLTGSIGATKGAAGSYTGAFNRPGGRGSFAASGAGSRWYASAVRRSVTCSAYSMAFWAYPTSGGPSYFVSTDNTGNSFSAILGYQANYWNAYRGSYPSGTASQSQIASTLNAWQHVCYSFSGSRVVGYLNGVQQIDVASSWAAITISALNIGQATSTPLELYSGRFDDVRLWSRGLNASEVRQLYNDSRAGYPRSLNYLDTDASYGATAAVGGNRRRRVLMGSH